MKPPHIVASVPPWPAGVQKVRRVWRPGALIQLVDPALQPGAWPARARSARERCCCAKCRRPTSADMPCSGVDPARLGRLRAARGVAAASAWRARHQRQRRQRRADRRVVHHDDDHVRARPPRPAGQPAGACVGSQRSLPVRAAREAGRHHRLRQHRPGGRAGVPLPGAGGVGDGSARRSARGPNRYAPPGTGRPRGAAAAAHLRHEPDGGVPALSRLPDPDHAADNQHPRHRRRDASCA